MRDKKANTKPRTPQEKGFDFEEEFADALGAEPQVGSGNQWYAKLDIDDLHVLWSLKHTTQKGFRLTPELMQEAVEAVHGPGGKGGDVLPGIAISINGEVFTIMRASDQLALLTTDERYISPSKAETKRATAKIPQLLREADDE